MKILVLDNYDSFTYNLVHYLEQVCDHPVQVFRNDAISLADVSTYDKILLSPGPGLPSEAGILNELIRTYQAEKDIFGVCLGLQAIGEVFGGKLRNLEKVYHGVSTPVSVCGDPQLFRDIPNTFKAGRYHSWVVEENTLPPVLEITARDEQGCIMALRHRKHRIRGVQFHPESILTEHGLQLIKNWVQS